VPEEVQLGAAADGDGLVVVLVHVVDEGEVVVGVPVGRVESDAALEMLDCQGVGLLLEVGQAEVVLHLRILRVELGRFLIGLDSRVVAASLVEGDTEVEEAERALGLALVEMLDGEGLELLPVAVRDQLQALLLEPELQLLLLLLLVAPGSLDPLFLLLLVADAASCVPSHAALTEDVLAGLSLPSRGRARGPALSCRGLVATGPDSRLALPGCALVPGSAPARVQRPPPGPLAALATGRSLWLARIRPQVLP
jgi:hypothetical protein